ncbi:MAG: HlyD family secretion protein, partial [Desulfocucumaceae bacterium]
MTGLSSEKAQKVISLAKNKKMLIVPALIVVGLVLFFLWNRGASKAGTYLTEPVSKGDITDSITASGTVDAENSVPLTFKNSAVIKGIYVKEGQRVTKGQLLAEQDDSDLRVQYQQQEASLKGAEAKLRLARAGARPEEVAQSEESANIARLSRDMARTGYERNKALFEQGAIAKSVFEAAENDLDLAEAKLHQAEEQLKALKAGNRVEDILSVESSVDIARAQLENARNNLEAAKMKAPADGIIGLVGAVVGQRTSAGNTTSSLDGFITLISDRMVVKAKVNEADIGRTAVGQKASFTVNSYPGRKFSGLVESISTKAETVSNVQLYQLNITLEKPEPDLKVGMPANVSVVANEAPGVIRVPKISVSFAMQNMKEFDPQAAGKNGGAKTVV